MQASLPCTCIRFTLSILREHLNFSPLFFNFFCNAIKCHVYDFFSFINFYPLFHFRILCVFSKFYVLFYCLYNKLFMNNFTYICTFCDFCITCILTSTCAINWKIDPQQIIIASKQINKHMLSSQRRCPSSLAFNPNLHFFQKRNLDPN